MRARDSPGICEAEVCSRPMKANRAANSLIPFEAKEGFSAPCKARGFYFALAFSLAQRLCCASAIFLRASALKTRFFLVLALAGAFFALGPGWVAAVPSVASRARACFSLAISASISTRMLSIAIGQG